MRTKRIMAYLCVVLLPALHGELTTFQEHAAPSLVSPSSHYPLGDAALNMFLNVDFLWWLAEQEGLFYAHSKTQGATSIPPNGNIDFDGYLEKVEPRWRPGCRIGFGGNMPYDQWDIFFNWTYYHTHPHESKTGDLLVLWGHPDSDSATVASSARASWLLSMNLLDAELGRAFWVGKHLSIRPFFGGRAAWIQDQFKVGYTYATTPSTDLKLKAKSNFEGGGIRAGVNAQFCLLKGWSFYAIGTTSLLYGRFNCDFQEKENGSLIAKTHDSPHQGISTTQLALGLRWDTCLHDNRYHIGVYAGWEQNMWFKLNKMNHFSSELGQGILSSSGGDLSLQGGTAGILFDF